MKDWSYLELVNNIENIFDSIHSQGNSVKIAGARTFEDHWHNAEESHLVENLITTMTVIKLVIRNSNKISSGMANIFKSLSNKLTLEVLARELNKDEIDLLLADIEKIKSILNSSFIED